MNPLPEEPNLILERFTRGEGTESDLQTLRRLLQPDTHQQTMQLGKYNISIGEGHNIQIGDHIYQGTDAEVLKETLKVVLQEERQNRRNRFERSLLTAVNHEVNARLKQSLHDAQFIQLNQEYQPEQVNNPFTVEVKGGVVPRRSNISITTPLQMFDSDLVAGRLLILGNPGAGKTTTLLTLAKVLIVRAKSHSDHPIPVLFNLSTWKNPKHSMQEWLVAELKSRYGVRPDVGRKWLDNFRLLPMLDGLDEVETNCQESCVWAINQLLTEKSWSFYLVVCSRQQEYEQLGTKLNLNGAIVLQPLTRQQIKMYLRQVDLPALISDAPQDSALADWLETPLLLSITTLAYQGISLERWQNISTPENRLRYLFDVYIQQMLTCPIQPLFYANDKEPQSEQTLHWLTWLSQQLEKNSQAEFLIERMQPSCLTQPLQRWQYRSLLAAIGMGCFVAPMYGLLAVHLRLSGKETVILFTGLMIGMILDWYRDIKPIETLKVSWKIPRKRLKIGLRNGLIFAVVGWLIGTGTPTPDHNGGFIGGVVGGVSAGIVGCIDGELIGPDIDTKTYPNQGMQRSALNAGICAVAFGVLFVLGFSLLLGIRVKPQTIAVFGLIGMISGGIIGGGLACLQHISLRLTLWLNGDIPWNYSRFLNYANQRLLLQRVGGRYQFIHALLQNHFANEKASQKW